MGPWRIWMPKAGTGAGSEVQSESSRGLETPGKELLAHERLKLIELASVDADRPNPTV